MNPVHFVLLSGFRGGAMTTTVGLSITISSNRLCTRSDILGATPFLSRISALTVHGIKRRGGAGDSTRGAQLSAS